MTSSHYHQLPDFFSKLISESPCILYMHDIFYLYIYIYLYHTYNLFQNQKSTNTAFYLENTTPTTSPIFVFSVFESVKKKRGVMK
jgi:hypothetical protein